MNHQAFITILAAHDIRPTANRLLIAATLANAASPLSMKEIEQQIQSIDKSSISRTLNLFYAHHLVHALDDGTGSVKYELCHAKHADNDEDAHVHFFCEQCHRTFCLRETPLPTLTLPADYLVQQVQLIVKGICPACRTKGKTRL